MFEYLSQVSRNFILALLNIAILRVVHSSRFQLYSQTGALFTRRSLNPRIDSSIDCLFILL